MAVAETAAVPVSTMRLMAATVAMLIAAPRAPLAQAALVSATSHVHVMSGDSAYRGMVFRAKDALSARRWRDAAQLWESALLTNAENGEHWHAYGRALYNSGRHKEAIGAYQRSMQLRAGNIDDAMWNVARSYAHLGNRKQALRWLEQALARGRRTGTDVSAEPVFRWVGPAALQSLEPAIITLLAARAEIIHT